MISEMISWTGLNCTLDTLKSDALQIFAKQQPDGPIPWEADECSQAGTVHVGGTLDEICESERAAWSDEASQRPFVLVAQQSLFDSSRAPEGKQVAWGYCHVPSGSTVDMTSEIENQIERFAPGFKDIVLARNWKPSTYSTS